MGSHQLGDRLSLYLVADPDHTRGDLASVVEQAIYGGVTAVQVRVKNRTDREFLAIAQSVRRVCGPGTLMFVNDRLDIALAVKADGVHLGVDDLPLRSAREIAGPGFLIGYSPESDEQARTAAASGADYLGVGPVFGTATKADAGQAIGLETIKRRSAMAGCPIIGIGGVTADNARSVVNAGAVGVAVVSAISKSLDPLNAAAAIRRALEG